MRKHAKGLVKIKVTTYTMNIRILTGKMKEIVDVMKRRNLDIFGLAKIKWKGEGMKELLYWVVNEEGRRNAVGWMTKGTCMRR